MAAKLLDRRRRRRCDASVGAVAFRAGPRFSRSYAHLVVFAVCQLKSLLLVSVLPALSLACNHPSTNGNGNGTGGYDDQRSRRLVGRPQRQRGDERQRGRERPRGHRRRRIQHRVRRRRRRGLVDRRQRADARPDAARTRNELSVPAESPERELRLSRPATHNDVVVAAYNKWKADTVTTAGAGGFQRVKRTQSDYTGTTGLELDSTVSEGIGYGMLIAVYMNDQALFDNLWKYEQLWPDDKTGLMNWYINAAGTHAPGHGRRHRRRRGHGVRAGDGRQAVGRQGLAVDELPRRRQGSDQQRSGTTRSTSPSCCWPGDGGRRSGRRINISYFAPAYYRVFDKVDTDTTHDWDGGDPDRLRHDRQHARTRRNKNASNGLVPAWCTSDGAPNGGAFGDQPTAPTNYQYDSCRTPFRIGIDWCWNGTHRRARLRREDQPLLQRRSARPTSSTATTWTARRSRARHAGQARRRSSARPASAR